MEAVTQETLRVLLPSKVALAVEEIAKARGTDPLEELPKFYASATYRALENERASIGGFRRPNCAPSISGASNRRAAGRDSMRGSRARLAGDASPRHRTSSR